AEDGIRDLIVTGVQTCALPISARQTVDRFPAPDESQKVQSNRWPASVHGRSGVPPETARRDPASTTSRTRRKSPGPPGLVLRKRSEERRVGKEGRESGGESADE